MEVELLTFPSDPMPTYHKEHLVRYGQRKHLNDFIGGKISFGAASIYEGQSNPAQRDNEHTRSWHSANAVLKIGGVDYPANDLVFARALKKPESGGSAYHLFCLSFEESPKLQRAFGCESYVVILNPHAFYDTILAAARSAIRTFRGTEFRHVNYYDDLNEPEFTSPSDIVFSKSIHYRYQNEFRLALYGASDADKRVELDLKWPDGVLSEIRNF